MPTNTLFLAFLFVVTSCASQDPILYRKHNFNQAQAQADIAYCKAEAERYVTNKRAGRQAIQGAAAGGAVGLLSSAITNRNIIAPTIAGATIGAGAGALGSLGNYEQNKRHYVKTCLRTKKYQIVGWD